jgi:hypothetical protein
LSPRGIKPKKGYRSSFSATVYVGELVSSEYRGAFGSVLGFSMSLGLQFVILVGEVAPDWRITTVACIIPVLLGKNVNILTKYASSFQVEWNLGIVALIFVPESPYFLAWKKGSIEAARPRLLKRQFFSPKIPVIKMFFHLFSLAWLLDNNEEEIQKSSADIKAYLETLVVTDQQEVEAAKEKNGELCKNNYFQ